MSNDMPALAQESVAQKWMKDKMQDVRNFGNWKSSEHFAENGKGSTGKNSPCNPSSPLSTSPVPRIQRIPSVLHLTQASRSLSPSPPPEEAHPDFSSLVFQLVVNLIHNVLSTAFHLLWNHLLIAPSLWMSVWLWIFWKCVILPFALIKWILTFLRTWPANGTRQRVVLISGGSTVQTLHLARNFYSAGARVIVCEIEGRFGLARFSTAVNKYYTVPKPDNVRAVNYVNALCTIVEKENVSYYIPVSATNEAFYDALAKPQLELLNCIVFCPTFKEVLLLDDLFEVLSKCRTFGLTTPSYYHINSRDDLVRLYDSGLLRTNRHFMTNVGPFGISHRVRLQVPPFVQDFRTSHEISHQKPWIVVQDMKGEHYVTCTTVKEGLVIGNVTCRIESDQKRSGLVPVDREEVIHWIQTFFSKLKFRGISGHFSFRLVVAPNSGTVVPIGCKVGVSLPYICFTSVHPRIVWKPCRHFTRQTFGPLVVNRPRYWMHDAVLSALRHPSVEALTKLVGTVLDKREALFVYWDPLPYCIYYHLQLPLRNIFDFVRGRSKKKQNFVMFPVQKTLAPSTL